MVDVIREENILIYYKSQMEILHCHLSDIHLFFCITFFNFFYFHFNTIQRYYMAHSHPWRDLNEIQHLHWDLLQESALSLVNQYGLQMAEILQAFQ